MDEDDECMESDYRTLQKEEYKSARAGKECFTFEIKSITYSYVFIKPFKI